VFRDLAMDEAGLIYDFIQQKKQDLLMNFINAKLYERKEHEILGQEIEEREKQNIERRNLEVELFPIWEDKHPNVPSVAKTVEAIFSHRETKSINLILNSKSGDALICSEDKREKSDNAGLQSNVTSKASLSNVLGLVCCQRDLKPKG
jgi:hypothetical protein